MAFIIAIQPDSQQAMVLLRALNNLPDLDVVVVESKDAALGLVDQRVPDAVLVHPLIDPGDDEHLAAYLRAYPPAAHVQVLTIPTLAAPRDVAAAPGLFERLRGKTARIPRAECDPRLFASDVVEYVSWARALKHMNDRRVWEPPPQDRRRAYRWSQDELPWVASVQMPGGEPAVLLDLSSGGVLVRTGHRPGPALFGRSVPQITDRRSLTFRLASGEEVHIAGQVIRCCVASRENATGLYEVAFRFDNPADACVPLEHRALPARSGHAEVEHQELSSLAASIVA
ncbi:MAG: hypothetical protein ACM3SQ_03005 [Betaproteobacteria bacterium]